MTAGYTYNGNGQRVKKTVSGTTTVFHYSLSGQLIAESNSAGSITAEYVYLNSQPLAKLEGADVYYYHNDNLSTPQKMTDASGTVVWAADYKPFGEATVTVSTITNNLRFSGQYYDAETGLNYNYFRDYNPVIGKYVEADPWYSGVVLIIQSPTKIGVRFIKAEKITDLGLYPYAKNSPIKNTDPSGLFVPPGMPKQCPPPPCNKTFGSCMETCYDTLNPWWSGIIGSGAGAAATFGIGGSVIGGAAAGATGWGVGSAVGCVIVCSQNPCYY
jgi:RHS repeat-associated protein